MILNYLYCSELDSNDSTTTRVVIDRSRRSSEQRPRRRYLRRAAGRARARARRAARGWAAAAAAAGSACAARRARCSPRPLHTNTFTSARTALAHARTDVLPHVYGTRTPSIVYCTRPRNDSHCAYTLHICVTHTRAY